ncbi:DoxX family protein [Sphingomonas sp. PAMC 26605]|uniref:DoxX family protein n=1 Tax=Sphingomonas sp. PAMC 26605 TaxID=1112214 RepID=UPI00026CB197|nr:DoxX family protein [Sphingomonas sp. PAMC 26605]
MIKLIVAWLPVALGVVMIGTGAANFAGPPLALKNFALWGYPAGFHRVAGSLGVMLGVLLIVPVTARVGAIGSTIFMLVAIATLIRSRDWGHLPGAAVLMAALVAAIVIQHRA